MLVFNTSPKHQVTLEQVIGRMPESSTRRLLLTSAGLVGLLGMILSMLLESYEVIVFFYNNSAPAWTHTIA